MEWTKMATIDRTHERAISEGLGISKHFIRQAVRGGQLPCIRSGKKALISWDVFLLFLELPANPEEKYSESKLIRAVNI